MVERALILSQGKPLIYDDLVTGKADDGTTISSGLPDQPLNLEAAMAGHIRRVLEMTEGKVHGRGGAAELLGINPSTLRNRMNQLGIVYGKRAKTKLFIYLSRRRRISRRRCLVRFRLSATFAALSGDHDS